MATNLLANETSPYLLQHAHNPVNWFPWSPPALQKAREEQKPILLSIGYSACHWCHVMAHESFENEETAQLMNKFFVNIKVDKEERPDLDKIYQTTHYLLTQQPGGWPLTVFLEPERLIPFFSGTYFPLHDRDHLPAFRKVLLHLAEIFRNQKNEIELQNQELLNILDSHAGSTGSNGNLTKEPIENALNRLETMFDAVNGGFGSEPKFPQPSLLLFLMNSSLSFLAYETLTKMANGGINDQLGGGFFRYTVDQAWLIPHFEKMLYDNGQLLFLYASAWEKTKNPLFKKTAFETAEWLIEEMQAKTGGFYASMDADSEGEEGKYYIWDKKEIAALLSKQTFSSLESIYGLDQPANFHDKWHLHLNKPWSLDADLQEARKILLSARKKRVAPALDYKILTGWNALTIKGMLLAGHVFNEIKFVESANRALDFIHESLWHDNHLLANNKYAGYLDDYACMIEALYLSGELTGNTDHLEFANTLLDCLVQHFYDKDNGGFYFTGNDQETLFYRPKIMMDEATPSGNAIACQCLLLAGNKFDKPDYLQIVEKTLRNAWILIGKYPVQHCGMLQVLQRYLEFRQK